MGWFDDLLGGAGDILGDVWDWFDDSDFAQDALGAILQQTLYDSPELDYDKIMEMAVQQALIDSPDQNTPTMTSTWDVDPETGKRTQNLAYRPEFQGLLDMLVQRAGSPKDTYRAPAGMTEDLLGSRMNHLLGQSGLDPVEHQRFQFPQYPTTTFGGDSFSGDVDEESDPSGPATFGPRGPGNETGDENPPVGGGYQGPGRDGYDPFDPSWENGQLIRDLTSRYGDYASGTDSPMGFNDWLNDNIGDNWNQGGDAEAWLLRNSDDIGKWLGRMIGSAAGIPGGGFIGDWLGDRALELYFQSNPDLVLSSPADVPGSPLDDFFDEVDENDPSTWGEGQSPIDRGGRDAWDAVGTHRTGGRTGYGVGDWSGPGELILDPRRYRAGWGQRG